MKSFKFFFAIGTLLLFTNCGPGEGTNGRTGNYDRNNNLEEDRDKDRDRDKDQMRDTSMME